MKAVNVDDVLKILHKYGKYVFATDEKKYSTMVDEIANLKALKPEPILDKIRAEIMQNSYPIVHGVNNHEFGMTLYGILQVLDKYKYEAESEAENEKDKIGLS